MKYVEDAHGIVEAKFVVTAAIGLLCHRIAKQSRQPI